MKKDKKIDKETILLDALIGIKEIAEGVLKKMAESMTEEQVSISAEGETKKGMSEAGINLQKEVFADEEVPEITNEENLSKAVTDKVSFGVEEPVEDQKEDEDNLKPEEMQKLKEIMANPQNVVASQEDFVEAVKNADEGATIIFDETEPQIAEEKDIKEMNINPKMLEKSNRCPKCNHKLYHKSKIKREGDGHFAINTSTCSNRGKKTWLGFGKRIEEPCDYRNEVIKRID
jgi:uncharacterized protein with PIN domain